MMGSLVAAMLTQIPAPYEEPILPRVQTGEAAEWKAYLKGLAGDDYVLLDRIATCESKWQMVWNYKHEENPEYYTSFGFFQITRGTAYSTNPSLDRMVPAENIELAVELYRKKGASPWNESRSCWSK